MVTVQAEPPAAITHTTTEQMINVEVDTAITQAVEKVGPAVVTVVGLVPGQDTFFGRTPDSPVSGSGVIISLDGYILTNNHVIADTIEVSIILADGTETPAVIIGRDEFSDLAVLKIESQRSRRGCIRKFGCTQTRRGRHRHRLPTRRFQEYGHSRGG